LALVSAEIILRPSVEQANLSALRDAYAKMQALSGTDNRSWIYWAEFHGFNHYDCWHHSRTGPDSTLYSYDLYWEHAVRDQNGAAIPPWWDWTSPASHAEGVPAAYSQTELDGQPNPLASGPTPDMPEEPARRTRRWPEHASELPSMTEKTLSNLAINTVLELTSYVDFSTQIQDVHDFIHPWVGGTDPANPNIGGDMGNIGVAAFDPIFWAHHAMIDRLWYLWQLHHGVNNIPPEYLPKVLAPFGMTVQHVLDVRTLGYEYASSAVSTAVGAPVAGAAGAGGQ
jgi:tyrosinase